MTEVDYQIAAFEGSKLGHDKKMMYAKILNDCEMGEFEFVPDGRHAES